MDNIAARDWSLSFQDLEFLSSQPGSVCLEIVLQICSVRTAGRFIENWANVGDDAVAYIAFQLDMPTARPHRSYSERTARRYRRAVARHLGLSRTQASHRTELEVWLREVIYPNGGSTGDIFDECFRWFQERRLIPPAEGTLTRSIRTARSAFVDDFLTRVAGALSPHAAEALETSLTDPRGDHGFQRLKDDVGASTLDNVLNAADRLAFMA